MVLYCKYPWHAGSDRKSGSDRNSGSVISSRSVSAVISLGGEVGGGNIWIPLGVDGDVSEPSSLDHLVRSWPREGQLVKYRVSGPRSAGLGRAKVVWQVVGGRTDWFRWARSGLQYVDGWTSVSLLDHGQPRDHTVKLPLKTIIHSPQSQLSPTPVSVSISTESACLTRV